MNLVIGAAIAVFVVAGIKVAVTAIAHPLLVACVAAGLIIVLAREGRVKALADTIPYYTAATIWICWFVILAACAVLAQPYAVQVWGWFVDLWSSVIGAVS